MQLESRQLADAQRRLAGEAEQSGRGGDPNGARRRSAEQERLADRMQRLEEAIRQMAGRDSRGQEAQRNALAETARELDRQRLSERMRQAARPGGQPPSGRGQTPAQGETPNGRSGRQSGGQTPQTGGQGQGGGQTPGREAQEIARELDRLSERLGAANGNGGESAQLSEQLSQIRDLREQLSQLERQLSELSRAGQDRNGQQPGGRGAQSGRSGEGEQLGGDENTPWDGARELLEEMKRSLEYRSPTADAFNPGRSAPGTEPWKQDFAQWEELKVQLGAALERAETDTAARLRSQQATDRLNAGAAQSVPEQYRRLVEQYYRALAAQEKR
jgi:hypothetical protein